MDIAVPAESAAHIIEEESTEHMQEMIAPEIFQAEEEAAKEVAAEMATEIGQYVSETIEEVSNESINERVVNEMNKRLEFAIEDAEVIQANIDALNKEQARNHDALAMITRMEEEIAQRERAIIEQEKEIALREQIERAKIAKIEHKRMEQERLIQLERTRMEQAEASQRALEQEQLGRTEATRMDNKIARMRQEQQERLEANRIKANRIKDSQREAESLERIERISIERMQLGKVLHLGFDTQDINENVARLQKEQANALQETERLKRERQDALREIERLNQEQARIQQIEHEQKPKRVRLAKANIENKKLRVRVKALEEQEAIEEANRLRREQEAAEEMDRLRREQEAAEEMDRLRKEQEDIEEKKPFISEADELLAIRLEREIEFYRDEIEKKLIEKRQTFYQDEKKRLDDAVGRHSIKIAEHQATIDAIKNGTIENVREAKSLDTIKHYEDELRTQHQKYKDSNLYLRGNMREGFERTLKKLKELRTEHEQKYGPFPRTINQVGQEMKELQVSLITTPEYQHKLISKKIAEKYNEMKELQKPTGSGIATHKINRTAGDPPEPYGARKKQSHKSTVHRFKLLQGEVLAGNDNPDIIDELSHLITKLKSLNMLESI